jgi:phasin family protein
MGRPREIVPLCASSFRAAAQNSADFHVFALSLRMGKGQLVLSQFRHRLRRRRTPEPQLEGFLPVAKQTGEQIVQDSTTEALARSGEAANEMIKGNVDALAETGNASRAAVQELTKAYQELTTKNVRNLTAAMQALAGVKSPAEYIELQQRLIKEGVETTVDDTKRMAQLTTAVFTAAFEPVMKRIQAVQNAAHP